MQTGLQADYESALARSQVPVSFAPALALSITVFLDRLSLSKYNRESLCMRAHVCVCLWCVCVCVRACGLRALPNLYRSQKIREGRREGALTY